MIKGLKRKIRKRNRIIESAIIKNSTRVTKVKYNGKVYKIDAIKYMNAMGPVRNRQWMFDKIILLTSMDYDT